MPFQQACVQHTGEVNLKFPFSRKHEYESKESLDENFRCVNWTESSAIGNTQDPIPYRAEGLALTHDTFSRNTRAQLRPLIEAVNQLMTPPDPPKQPIGFATHEDKGKAAKSRF